MQRFLAIILALTVIALSVPAFRHWRETPPPPPPAPLPVRAEWNAPPELEIGGGGDYSFGLALAPDGRRLVFPAAKDGLIALWLHDLSSGESRALPGTDGAVAPFWSADGMRVGFFSDDHVRAIDLKDGQVTELADAPAGNGGTFVSSDEVIFSPATTGGLMRRSAEGVVTPFTTLDATTGETAHHWPVFMKNAGSVIFLVTARQPEASGLWIAPIGDPSARRRLVPADTQALVVDNDLLYLRDATLVAQPIDPQKLEPSGRSTTAGISVGSGPLGQIFATAAGDVLIYGGAESRLRELKWMARDGKPAGSPGEPIDAWDVRIAPDGRRLVTTEIDHQLRTLDVFIRTGTQPAPSRLSLSTDVDESGVWSPDGLRIAWAGQRRKVMIRGAGAVLPEQTVATFDSPVQVWDWSPDGRALLIGRRGAGSGDDLWIQPPVEDSKATPYAVAPFDQVFGAFAPDGGRIAYASNESGHFDVYLDAYPTPGSRVRLTTNGGTEPRWSANGREVYFRRGSEIHAITLDGFTVRSTQRLFDAGATIRSYDVSRDGRFVINVPASTISSQSTTSVVTNWRPRP